MALNITSITEVSKLTFNELTNITFPEYYATIKPLIFFVMGITIYALFIFKFYKFLARRDIIKLRLHKYSQSFAGFFDTLARIIFYIIENLIIIPLCVFFWFAFLAVLLLLFAETPNPNTVLLASVALVSTVRITAYYNENLSQDLAKMIPFALLGVFLIKASYFSVHSSLETAKQFLSLWRLLAYYLLFVIVMEFALRALLGIVSLFVPRVLEKNS